MIVGVESKYFANIFPGLILVRIGPNHLKVAAFSRSWGPHTVTLNDNCPREGWRDSGVLKRCDVSDCFNLIGQLIYLANDDGGHVGYFRTNLSYTKGA